MILFVPFFYPWAWVFMAVFFGFIFMQQIIAGVYKFFAKEVNSLDGVINLVLVIALICVFIWVFKKKYGL